MPVVGDAEVRELEVPVLGEDQVLGLDVVVDDVVEVDVLDCQHQASHHEPQALLVEPGADVQVVPQVPACQQVHQQVQVLTVLEGLVQVDQKGVVQLSQDLLLVHDRLDTFLGQHLGLRHHFQCVVRSALLLDHPPHPAETPVSDRSHLPVLGRSRGCLCLRGLSSHQSN